MSIFNKINEFINVGKQLYGKVEKIIRSDKLEQILDIINVLSKVQSREYIPIDFGDQVKVYRVEVVDHDLKVILVKPIDVTHGGVYKVDGVKFIVDHRYRFEQRETHYIVRLRKSFTKNTSITKPVELKYIINPDYEPIQLLSNIEFVVNLDLILKAIDKAINYYVDSLDKTKQLVSMIGSEKIDENLNQIKTRLEILTKILQKQ